MWFFLEDISVGYALPQMPNTLAIGDLMAGRPGKALPGELEDFLSQSKDGVILVSFGTYLDFVTPDVVRKFCTAFNDRRNRLRVVWKAKPKAKDAWRNCPDAGRIKTMPWIPQNDLLADRRVKVFISHGGLNSVIESVYHATPLIVFPICGDQPSNAAAAVSKGLAVRMDIGSFSAESLLSSVEKLLSDATYERNVQLASAILRDRRVSPAQRVSDAVEHVVKYGDGHLRTGAFQLSVVQFFMFDLFAAVLLAAVASVALVAFLASCCVCGACRRRMKRNKSKTA